MQDSEDTLGFLQLESELMREETHSKLVHVHKNHLHDFIQQPLLNYASSKSHKKISGTLSEEK